MEDSSVSEAMNSSILSSSKNPCETEHMCETWDRYRDMGRTSTV